MSEGARTGTGGAPITTITSGGCNVSLRRGRGRTGSVHDENVTANTLDTPKRIERVGSPALESDTPGVSEWQREESGVTLRPRVTTE
ncbi:hypothetical protein GCM10027444_36400 [Actinopolyspora lacussalsi]